MSLTNYTFTQICQMLVVPAFFATLKMLLISGVLSTIFGFVFGVILILTEKGGLCQNVVINPYSGFSCKYDTFIPVYYFDDFHHSIYKINCWNINRRNSSARTADCSMYSVYGENFPEQF